MNPRWRAALKDVADGIRTQPGRAGLAFLAILVGIMALTVLLAVLGGLQERSRQIVEDLGINVFAILEPRAEQDQSTRPRLGPRHVDFLRAALPACVVSGFSIHDGATPGNEKRVKVVACDSALIRVRQWRMQSGRFLDEEDLRGRSRHAVISEALSTMWGWEIGDDITLKSTPYRVVGILEVGGGALEAETSDPGLVLGERAVFVPRSAPAYWLPSGAPRPGLDGVFVRVPRSADLERVMALAQGLIAQPDQGVQGLTWVTPESLLRRVRRLQATIRLTVGSIAILCLILGATTLTSLMVANVRDRVTEIGLRRALGATRKDIAALFVLEACLVTAAAALVGTLGTHLLLLLGRSHLPVPVGLGTSTLLLPILVAVGLGMVAAYWPARSAAAITPSEALRNE